MKIFTALLLTFVSLNARANDQDCGRSVEQAIGDCKARLDGARQSKMDDFQGASGMNSGGSAQSAAARYVSDKIGEASSSCVKSDQEQCNKQCSTAFKKAQQIASTELVNAIRKNVQRCNDKIEELRSAAQTDRMELAKVSEESRGVANSAGEQGQMGQTPDGTPVNSAYTTCGYAGCRTVLGGGKCSVTPTGGATIIVPCVY